MSREYIFYPAFKDEKTKKIKPLLTNLNGKPASIFWRSGSFIDGDYFTEKFPMLEKEEFDDSCAEYFSDRYEFENAPTYVYCIGYDALVNAAFGEGIISGYALIEEMKEYYDTDYKDDYLKYEMSSIVPAEIYAELPQEEQNKYGKFTAINHFSCGYICSILLEVLNDLYVPYDWEGEKCILMLYSF